jgi:TPR repeat protein
MSARSWLLLLILNAGLLWAGPTPTAPASKETVAAERAAAFADAKKRAEAGDAKAMLEHGFNHMLGLGTPIDMPTAAEWIRRAAEKGNEDAYFPYGQICQRGEMRPKDLKEAHRWFRLAAAKQNADAELSLAQAYEQGAGVEKDAKESRRWLELSATHGHPNAQEALAWELCESENAADLRQANEWLLKAALQGNPRASVLLGVNHILAKGTAKNVALGCAWILLGEKDGDEELREIARQYLRDANLKDLPKARSLARGLAEKIQYHPIYSLPPEQLADNRAFRAQFELAQGGKAADQYQLACLYHAGKGTLPDPVEAAKWCRKAAEQGHLQAMKSLAGSYRDGDGVEQDERAMVSWLRKAAVLDDADAQCELSIHLSQNGATDPELTEADKWLRKAATLGQPIAQANLGSRLIQSDDPAKNEEAARWFKLSAMQGHPLGMFKYGMMLFLGMGVPKNDVEGAAWLLVCDPGDDESLRTAIKDILEKLPADKLPKAKAAAIEIRKTL